MSGVGAGSFYACDCGAEIIYTKPCPDAAEDAIPICGCGAEFVPSTAQTDPEENLSSAMPAAG